MVALAIVVILRLVVVVIALRVAMLVSGAASSSSAIVPASRARVTLGAPVAQSLTATGHTKTSIVGTLKILADAGMIKDVDGVGDADVRALKRKLTVAATAHGNVQTKYGTVIQKVKLDAKGVEYWEYMNPFAFPVLLQLAEPQLCSHDAVHLRWRDAPPHNNLCRRFGPREPISPRGITQAPVYLLVHRGLATTCTSEIVCLARF